MHRALCVHVCAVCVCISKQLCCVVLPSGASERYVKAQNPPKDCPSMLHLPCVLSRGTRALRMSSASNTMLSALDTNTHRWHTHTHRQVGHTRTHTGRWHTGQHTGTQTQTCSAVWGVCLRSEISFCLGSKEVLQSNCTLRPTRSIPSCQKLTQGALKTANS